MNKEYSVDYQINKLNHKLSTLSDDEYEFFMSEYPLTVPAPDTCIGTANKHLCPRSDVIKAVFIYNPDPCESCMHYHLNH